MAPRTSPTERQRRLGAELRKLRVRSGMSGDQAGAVIGADRTRISHIEAGRADVPRNGLHKLLCAYGCAEGPLFEGLMAMAQDRGKGWWDDFRGVIGPNGRDLVELEARAAKIRIHEPLFIPGMLQTADYAKAMFAVIAEGDPNIDRYVQFRIARQHILGDENPVHYHTVIHESALRVRVVGASAMRRQLRRLIEFARLPNVTIQIFPFEAGPYSGFSRPFVLFSGSTPELDTAYLEHPQGCEFVGEVDRTGEYARMFERLSALALAPVDPDTAPEAHEGQDSLSLIQHVMYDL